MENINSVADEGEATIETEVEISVSLHATDQKEKKIITKSCR